jgi:LPXTG-site transpeptidase (sortase) family protein
MDYLSAWKRRREKKYKILYKRGPSNLALVFAGMALATWLMFALLSSYPVLATLYYSVFPSTSGEISQGLVATASEGEPIAQVVASEEIEPIDPTLPQGHYLSIPKIGVDTTMWEAGIGDYESALRRGVWRVPDFAAPGETGRPMILAAHRFGYLEWTQQYRQKNSFYNLPSLKVGDRVEVISDQRRYTYEVTRVEEGTAIDDYSGDLILYTCKFLVSPIRYFVYARLVQ